MSDFIGHARRYWRLLGSIAFTLGVVVTTAFLAHCKITTADQANWKKTTGMVGTTGEVSVSKDGEEGGGKVDIVYKDPETGADTNAQMHVSSREVAQSILDRPTREVEAVFVYKGLVGNPTVCTQTDWEECRKQASPPWWGFLILAGLLVIAVLDLRSHWRSVISGHRRMTPGHHTHDEHE